MPKRNLIITVDEKCLDQLDSIRRQIEAVGVKVSDMIPAIGTVFGTSDTDSLARLRAVKGIEAISFEDEKGDIKLPPLNPKVPQ